MSTRHNARYGWPHRRRRRAWALQVAAGTVSCSRCGLLIEPGMLWDLDHADGGGPASYLGPAHRSCNRSAGARLSGSQTSPYRVIGTPSRDW